MNSAVVRLFIFYMKRKSVVTEYRKGDVRLIAHLFLFIAMKHDLQIIK